jgi:fatty acid desaturase
MSLKSDAIQRTRSIRAVIRSEERRLRLIHPWLAHQNLLGMSSFLGSLVVMVGVATLYLQGMLVWWMAIPLMALPVSILHEIEHDLIHDLYFKGRDRLQNFMFFVIWFCKLNLNPWYRREIHLKHHRESGQVTDIEERLIGLGLPIGLLRIFVTIHPYGGLLLFPQIKREVPDFQPLRLYLLSMPTYTLLFVIWESFFGYIRVQSGWTFAMDPAQLLPAWGWPWARDLTVLLVLPNVLRQSCLVFMSSYCHYYEDIPMHDVFYQNQILSNWMLFPIQMFCFNFGATHITHHYVINQPFYLRQMVSRAAHAEMSRQGTRVNDLHALVRANRWGAGRDEQEQRQLDAA